MRLVDYMFEESRHHSRSIHWIPISNYLTRIDKAMQMPKLISRTLPKLACWYHTSLHPSSWYTSWDSGNGMFIELIKFPYLSRLLIIASYFIQCFTFTSGYFNIPLQKGLFCSLHVFIFHNVAVGSFVIWSLLDEFLQWSTAPDPRRD